MQLREDDVGAALLRRCGGAQTVWVRRCSSASAGAPWGRRGSNVKVVWGLRGGGMRASLARVATVWGRRGSGVEAVLGQCKDGMGVMLRLQLR